MPLDCGMYSGDLLRTLVYNSLHTSIDKETLAILKRILGADVSTELGNRPKQNGTANCGIFAIATCVSIATGSQLKNYIQRCIHNHVLVFFNCIFCQSILTSNDVMYSRFSETIFF